MYCNVTDRQTERQRHWH